MGGKRSLSQNPQFLFPVAGFLHFITLCSVNEVLVDLPRDCSLCDCVPGVSPLEDKGAE